MRSATAPKGRRSRAGGERSPRSIAKRDPSLGTSTWFRRLAFLGVLGTAAALVGIMVFAGSKPDAGTWIEQGRGGSWTNVTSDRLATMLAAKDFTLVGVKTPYMGEIEGTDLYIPYTDLAARANELPAARSARILVYCRSGNQSRLAAQILLDLGYTNVWNLDKGMESWVASGRTIVQRSRT